MSAITQRIVDEASTRDLAKEVISQGLSWWERIAEAVENGLRSYGQLSDVSRLIWTIKFRANKSGAITASVQLFEGGDAVADHAGVEICHQQVESGNFSAYTTHIVKTLVAQAIVAHEAAESI